MLCSVWVIHNQSGADQRFVSKTDMHVTFHTRRVVSQVHQVQDFDVVVAAWSRPGLTHK